MFCGGLQRRTLLGASFVVTCLIMAMPVVASAGRQGLSPLQQGLNFYRGKTLTFNVPSAAGSGVDIKSRDLAAQMAAYLGATINVVDYPQGNSLPGQDATAGARPDGLTFGILETGNDAINAASGGTGLDFNPAHEVFLGGWPNTPMMLTALSSAPYSTFASLEKVPAADPIRIISLINNATTLTINLLLRAFNIPYYDITGYANSSAEVAGFERGDAPFVFLSIATIAPLVKGGIARPLAVTNAEPPSFVYYSLMRGLPTFAQLLSREKIKTQNEEKAAKYALEASSIPIESIGAPSAVKADRYDALRAAVKYGLNSSILQNQYILRGEPTGYVQPSTDKSLYLTGAAVIGRALRFVGAG